MTDIAQDMDTEKPALVRTRRSGAIELLQVFSVIAFVAAFLTRRHSAAVYLWSEIALGVLMFLIPYFLIQLPQPEPDFHGLPKGPHGFQITRARRRTLAQLSVPPDILSTIDESIFDVYYQNGTEFREALYQLLGEARVRPWLGTIFLHSKVYRPTAEGERKTSSES
jgi:hypothetical protein